MKKIVVKLVDEDQKAASKWKRLLEAVPLAKGVQLDVQVFDIEKDLKPCVEELMTRREAARGVHGRSGGKPQGIDDVDVFIVDYDLLGDKGGVPYTGEDLAYWVRAYSGCKIIVAINQFSGRSAADNPFELDLSGHPESYADINITAAQINNDGLWHSPWTTDFRPWYWPVIPDLVEKFDARVNFVRQHLDQPLLSSLGIDDDLVKILPRKVEAFLGGKKGEVSKTTFRAFVESSGNGLKPKDKEGGDAEGMDRVCRLAAARVSRWLEDMVLSGQEILVDAPHLVARHPWLLKAKNLATKQVWDKTANIPSGARSDEKLGIDFDAIRSFRIDPIWTSRPAWFWPKIVARAQHPGAIPRGIPDLVFCEDTSRFEERSNAKQFVSGVESSHIRRYVSGRVAGVTYRPEVRFSM